MTDIVALARHHRHIAATHYEGCEADHIGCLVGKLADEIERLRADLEIEGMRLVACSIVANANTPKSAAEARKMHSDYRSGSLEDVERMVDDNIALRAEAERLRQQDALLLQAVGLLTTLAPRMEINPDDPVRMAQQVLAEVERMRAERDTLLLDAREFVRWFDTNFAWPRSPSMRDDCLQSDAPDYPWRRIHDRLKSHSDTLATLDAVRENPYASRRGRDTGTLLAEVERLRAGWRPIESAPRDGTWILLWDQRREVAVSGCWHDEPERNSPNGYEPGWSWWSADNDLMIWDGDDAPTYWMPLPQPPKEGAS